MSGEHDNFADFLGGFDEAIIPSGWGEAGGYTHVIKDGDKIHIRNIVDAQAIDEDNRQRRNESRRFGSEITNLVAQIPLKIYFSIPQHIRDDDRELLKWIERMNINAGVNYKTTDKRLA